MTVRGVRTRAPMIKTHKDLDVWRGAVGLAKDIYAVTQTFSKEEWFGLVLQLRRTAVSIASNIAEGSARQTTKELVQFLYMAAGSASELDTQLEIARAVSAGKEQELLRLQTEAARGAMMLRALIKSLKA